MPGPIPGLNFQGCYVNTGDSFGPGGVHEYVYSFIFMSKLEVGWSCLHFFVLTMDQPTKKRLLDYADKCNPGGEGGFSCLVLCVYDFSWMNP